MNLQMTLLLVSFFVTVVAGAIIIPILQKLKVGQNERDDGPKSHLKKQGTPTMGGIMMIVAILVTILTRSKVSGDMAIGLISIVGFGLVGFLDDFLKIKFKRSLGLKAWQKLALQVGLSVILAYYQYMSSPSATIFTIPFTTISFDLGILYIPVMVFIILGTVNAVNLTDGLDGLASGITVIVSTFFMLLALSYGNTDVAILAATTVGACIGFLGFNSYPARVFMGDTGSMALGGAVISFAVLTNSVLIIPIVGGIYFAEAISVILQVGSYKLRKKRIFKMAPIHHHFEQCGWPETKVIFVFWITTILLAWIGIIAVF